MNIGVIEEIFEVFLLPLNYGLSLGEQPDLASTASSNRLDNGSVENSQL